MALQLWIVHRQHAVIDGEFAERACVRGVRLIAEHDLPAVRPEQLVQRAVHVLAVRADMDAADLALEQVEERREDDDLRLLDVGVEVVDELQQHCLRDRYALVTPILVTSAGEIAFDGSQVYLDTGRIKRVRRPDGAGSRGEVISDRLLGDGRPARAWLPGTCLALHRDLLSKAGGFHEPYFLYWEDLDLSYRCQDVGGSLVIRHDLAVVHDEGGTQQRPGGRALSQRYYYWNCRNRLLFAARHLPTRQVVRWMLHTPAESWQIVLRGGRRQLLHSPAPLVAAVRGSLAGLMIAACAVFGRRPSIRSYPVI